MKKAELIFSAILVPLDYLMLFIAGSLAYTIRFSEFYRENIREAAIDLPFHDYLQIVLVVALFWLFIFAVSGLYSIGGTRRKFDELAKVFMACSTGVMAVIIYIFFKRELFSSRFIVLAAWILSVLFVIFGRMLIRHVQQQLFKRGIGLHKIIVIGNSRLGNELIDVIKGMPKLGYEIVKQFSEYNERVEKSILELHQRRKIDEIVQASPSMGKTETLQLLDFVNYNHITFRYLADLLGTLSTNLEVQMLRGIPLVELKRTKLDGWGSIYKRIFDIIGSILGIIVFSPIMLIAAIAIKIDSKGTVLFKYKRIGRKGEPFTFVKFRSMHKDVHHLRFDKEFQKQAGGNLRDGTPMIKFKNDPRITRVGNFIRKYSIDELPQFFCVLAGTMSLVGPRPHEPEEVERYTKHHRKVLALKPGITGLAQIAGRSDLDFEEEVKLDTFYIENWSLIYDIIILVKTPFVLLKTREAS